MTSRLRWTLLGIFSLAGIGAAVSLGLSTDASLAKGSASRVAPRSVEADVGLSLQSSEPGPLHEGSVDEAPNDALQPPLPATTDERPNAVLAQPFPPRQENVQGADLIRTPRRSDPTWLAQATPRGQRSNATGDPFADDPPPVPGLSNPPTAAPPALAPRSGVSIEDEGDNRLRLEFQGADLRVVLKQLAARTGVNILLSNSVQGNISLTLENVDFPTALKAVLSSTGYVFRRDGNVVYVGSPKEILDLEHANDTIATRIYHPNYVSAKELKLLLVPFLSADVGKIEVNTPPEVGIAPDSNLAGGDSYAGTDVVVIRDYQAVLDVLDQMIKRIDRRPMQVAIEAMILSVKLNDEFSFGVDFELLRDNSHARLVSGKPLLSLDTLDLSKGGLKFGYLDSSFSAFVSALEVIGDTNVIATPRVLCLNKHRAEIHIGRSLGYISSSQTETSTTQSVEFLEVGTQLRLRPFISSDGMVRMEVHPEISSGEVDTTGLFPVPNKDVTQVTTNIMCRDGCTVVIGGLLSEDLINTDVQIPLLGSLPYLGALFRQKNELTRRSEIIVLITPRIVYEPEICAEGCEGAMEFHRRQDVVSNHMSPFSKRYLAKRYYRLAQDAWAAGLQKKAAHFISTSIRFEPTSRAAIQLREEIYAGVHGGTHTSDGPPGFLPHSDYVPPPYAAAPGNKGPFPPGPGHWIEPGDLGPETESTDIHVPPRERL